LCRHSSGFVGWTPYLAGRALTMGTPRAMTAASWAPYAPDPERLVESRIRLRRSLGIPEHAIVVGITGRLAWSRRLGYCYGHELVQAVLRSESDRICALIVGDGDGKVRLETLAGKALNHTVFLPGRVPREQVPDYLAAMDVGSLPQSVDGVGTFRYTTKISEYFSVGLPFITNEIPAAYDLDYGGLWRLPGEAPWDPCFIDALVQLLTNLTLESIKLKRNSIPAYIRDFDRDVQVQRVTNFVNEIARSPQTHG